MAEETIDITVLCDNYAHTPGMKTQWGFACLVEASREKILFDTGGDGEILLDNMEEVGIAPADIDKVVISHDHWDHTGGLSGFLEHNSQISVYVLTAFSPATKRLISSSGVEVVEVSKPVEICPGVFSTGEVRAAPPEQALIIKTEPGLVVVTGCAHPGVVAMVARAKEVCSDEPYLVMGGFHMQLSDRQIRQAIAQLHELGLTKAGPCHCSGDRARQLFKEEFGENYISVGVGKHLEFTR